MADIEKVIKALELCIADIECTDCSYEEECFSMDCEQYAEPMMRDALELLKEQQDALEQMRLDNTDLRNCNAELLKEQEAVEPQIAPFPDASRSDGSWYFICSACTKPIDPNDKYCRECGKPILWEDR